MGKVSKKDTYIILTIVLGLIAGCIYLGISLLYGFLGSILLMVFILNLKGFSYSQLWGMVYTGLIECRILYLLILLIGATVSVWMSSGVVPAMIFYGLEYMKSMNFLLASFLITSISAIFMGTAVGTISTIGIALLGIGKGFGIPPHILLGAIVSGAFIADKISPISGLLNLTLTTTKTKYKEALRTMLVTLAPVYVITALGYYYIGINYSIKTDLGSLIEYQSAIIEGFNISPWLLLLPILIIFLSIMGIKTFYTISIGLLGGIIASAVLQIISVSSVFHYIIWGYKGNTSSTMLNSILVSGGVISMVEVVLIVAGAISISSILEKSGIIKPMINKIISSIHSEGGLILKTGFISSILTIVTCDQTVGIVLPGRLLRDKYEALRVDSSVLARTISDTGTVIAPLMPWNVNALIIVSISGIPAISYGPYAILCYISPIVTILLSNIIKVKRQPSIKATTGV